MKISLNLLPEEKKKKIKRKDTLWLIIRQEILFLFAIFFLIAMLLSTSYILDVQSEGVKNMNSTGDSQGSYQDIQKYEEKFKETNLKTAALAQFIKKHLYWSEALERLSMLTPDGVSLSNLATKNYQISIAGKAKTRDDLLKFQDNLGKDDCFSDINVPLSNLVTRENIDFQIDFNVKPDCLTANK